MKNRRIVSAFLAVSLLLLLFTGCAKTPDRAETPEPVKAPDPVIEGPGFDDLVETDSLVIYIMKDYESIEMNRIDQFRLATGVNVEVVSVDGDIFEYTERVINDLAAGSGPDVLCLSDAFTMDVTKAAMNGSFLDLTDILAEDPEFSEDDYLDGVFEACQVNGRQYMIPTSYDLSFTVATDEKLKELGFEWDKINSMSDFIKEIAYLTPDITEDPGFQQMLHSKNFFSKLLRTSGICLLNYETGEVLPDEKELREFLEAYKLYFPYDYDETGTIILKSRADRELMAGLFAFWFPSNIESIVNSLCAMQLESCEYVYHVIPDQTEEITGYIYSQMAISANSKNSLNAYKFIKFFLSEEAQKNKRLQQGILPIHKGAIEKSIYEAPAVYENHGQLFYDYETPAFSEEEAEILEAAVTGVDRFVLRVPQNVTTMVQESMLPFFRDEKSYEECFDDLKNKLTLYLSE